MKAVKSKITKTLQVGSELIVADNSGARRVRIIAVKGYKGVKRRRGKAGVADVVICTVKDGPPDVKHKVFPFVIIRQRKEYRRPNGVRIKFEDNAAIMLKDVKNFEPKGTVIKGPVAREVIERFPKISRIASMVV